MDLPKRNESRVTENKGLDIVKNIFQDEHKWIFRKVPLEEDYGIDAYIDILEDGKYITGKTIAIQVKSGRSYFETKNNIGWIFYGESKHLNYYLNHDVPVLIVLVDIETKSAYWIKVDINQIIKTPKNWKITVPKNQQITQKSKLKSITSGYIDYTKQIEKLELINNAILQHKSVYISIDKEEIESFNFEGFETLLLWLTKSEEMIVKNRGKFFIAVFGYNDDERELCEIPIVRKWFKSVLPKFKYWGYFLSMESYSQQFSAMKVLLSCCVKIDSSEYIEQKKGWIHNFDQEELEIFVNQMFEWLNEFTETYNISLKVNYDQTMKIMQTVTGIPEEEMKKIRAKKPPSK